MASRGRPAATQRGFILVFTMLMILGISVMGVALGVMVLVIVTSVMGGFGYELRRMIVQLEGEVQVKSQSAITDVTGIMRAISATPGIAAGTAYVAGPVMVLCRWEITNVVRPSIRSASDAWMS